MRNLLPLCCVAFAAVIAAGCMDDPTSPVPLESGPRFDVTAGAGDLVVNSLDDVDDGTCDVTHCSLREAIAAANSNGQADTITFDEARRRDHLSLER